MEEKIQRSFGFSSAFSTMCCIYLPPIILLTIQRPLMQAQESQIGDYVLFNLCRLQLIESHDLKIKSLRFWCMWMRVQMPGLLTRP